MTTECVRATPANDILHSCGGGNFFHILIIINERGTFYFMFTFQNVEEKKKII